MASINDVAKAAGVSKSTVSRVINNNPSISNVTKEKVMKVIKELNYSPNSIAQSLSNNNSYTITLIVDIENEKSFYNSFFYEVMHGIEKVVYQQEHCLVISNLNTTIKGEDMIDWLIKSKRTEGIILPSSIIDSKLVSKLKKHHIPFVLIGEPVHLKETVSWVDINNLKAGEQATHYLIEHHREKIGFIGYDPSEIFNQRRFEGYKHALESNGIVYNAQLVKEGSNSRDDGYRMMKALLSENDVPDAVICADNLMSIGAIRAIQEIGLSIPQDISLISFDSTQIAEIMYPNISTINVDVYELGMRSAKLLFESIENPDIREQEVLISTNIDERETT